MIVFEEILKADSYQMTYFCKIMKGEKGFLAIGVQW